MDWLRLLAVMMRNKIKKCGWFFEDEKEEFEGQKIKKKIIRNEIHGYIMALREKVCVRCFYLCNIDILRSYIIDVWFFDNLII